MAGSRDSNQVDKIDKVGGHRTNSQVGKDGKDVKFSRIDKVRGHRAHNQVDKDGGKVVSLPVRARNPYDVHWM